MDPIKILQRSWYILWSYRALWVFGLILALAGAGANGRGNNNVQYQTDGQSTQAPLPEDMREAFQEMSREMQRLFQEGLTEAGIPKEELTALIWIAIVFVLFSLALGVIVAIGRYISETAVIRMVDEYENSGNKMTIREGFRVGWSRTSWRLFLINLLVNLPLILVVILLLIFGFIIFITISGNNDQATVFTVVGSIGILFLVIFVAVILSVLLRLLRNFFWRVCALENAGVGESLRRGFQMVRENWKNVGVMWLVMIGLGIAWAIVFVIAVIVTLPVVLITSLIGVIVAAIPILLAVGIASLFLSGWLPWIVGVVYGLPLFLIIAFSPWLLLGSWQSVFTSTVWTLTYRELKALPALAVESKPIQV
jgi:hypothetical protein